MHVMCPQMKFCNEPKLSGTKGIKDIGELKTATEHLLERRLCHNTIHSVLRKYEPEAVIISGSPGYGDT